MVEMDRRTVTKAGAAFIALPIITFAEAAPAFAASGTPTCPTCLTATGGAFTEQLTALANSSTAVSAGTLVFNLSASGCDVSLFQPAYTVAGTSVTVNYTDNGNSVSQTFSTAAITGAGSFASLSAFTAAFSVPGNSIPMPADTNPPYNPVTPTSITVKFTAIFLGLGGVSLSCPYTVTFPLTNIASTGGVTSGLTGGTGTVNFTGTAGAGTINSG